MKAMILAAGLGTRLRPLTENRPKALVEVKGRTLLEITLSRLRVLGIRDVVVNAHHFAAMILEYLKANDDFEMHIEVSCEETLLDTGGGLKKASYFFLDGDGEQSFLLHNVDVLSTFDLGRMAEFHRENAALATLAVQDRKSSRYLLFDENSRLCGRLEGEGSSAAVENTAGVPPHTQALAFCGIHVLSSRIFDEMTEQGAFSIIATYLRLAAKGEKIIAFRDDAAYWRDLGKPESVLHAAREIEGGTFSI